MPSRRADPGRLGELVISRVQRRLRTAPAMGVLAMLANVRTVPAVAEARDNKLGDPVKLALGQSAGHGARQLAKIIVAEHCDADLSAVVHDGRA